MSQWTCIKASAAPHTHLFCSRLRSPLPIVSPATLCSPPPPLQDLSIWQPMPCAEVPETFRLHTFRLADLLGDADPALVEAVHATAALLPPRMRRAIAAFSFSCLPMQLHAVRPARVSGDGALGAGSGASRHLLHPHDAAPRCTPLTLPIRPRSQRTHPHPRRSLWPCLPRSSRPLAASSPLGSSAASRSKTLATPSPATAASPTASTARWEPGEAGGGVWSAVDFVSSDPAIRPAHHGCSTCPSAAPLAAHTPPTLRRPCRPPAPPPLPHRAAHHRFTALPPAAAAGGDGGLLVHLLQQLCRALRGHRGGGHERGAQAGPAAAGGGGGVCVCGGVGML